MMSVFGLFCFFALASACGYLILFLLEKIVVAIYNWAEEKILKLRYKKDVKKKRKK